MDLRREVLQKVVFLGLLVVGAHAWAQGPLAPSAAPAAAMKSLAVIEPRVPISAAGAVISQPGSYYLTTNLTVTGHGVTIQSDAVVLDLNGFSIAGDKDNGDAGIYINGGATTAYKGIVVRNGCLRQFGYGVYMQHAGLCSFEDLSIQTNRYGLFIQASLGRSCGNRFERCRIAGNLNYGIYMQAASSAQCNGNLFRRCLVERNGAAGIVFYPQSSSQCDGNLISDCVIVENGGVGFQLGGAASQCDGNAIVRCTISDNETSGLYLNGQNARVDGNWVSANTLSRNEEYGLRCYGADGNRIEGNHVSETSGGGRGIVSESTSVSNLVVRNVCSGQAVNLSVGAQDSYGPAVSASGELATSGDAAHPWANMTR